MCKKGNKARFFKDTTVFKIIVAIAAIILLYIISDHNYLFFHFLTEGFSVIVAILIFILAEKTYKYSENNFLLFLGIAYAFVAIFDFLHMSTYKGMGIFKSYGPDVPTQIWIAGRFLEAVSMSIAVIFINRKFSKIVVSFTYIVFTAIAVYSILFADIFPVCFVEGKGLTKFKIVSEYIIIVILLTVLYCLYRKRKNINISIYKTIKYTIIVTLISELSFTLYNDVYGIMNVLGHILKLISFIIIFKGIIQTGIEKPHDVIYKKLKEASIKDPLTDIYNRRYFIQQLQNQIERNKRTDNICSLIMLDIDNFKDINDEHGHNTGDKVIKSIADMINRRIRKTDILARWGGEEYVILLPTTPLDKAKVLAEDLRISLSQMNISDLGRITASFGVAGCHVKDSADTLIDRADNMMYKAKTDGKNCVRHCG